MMEYEIVSIERLRKELHGYIDGVSREQFLRQKETLPTPAELFKMRCHDAGVIPSITQNEYVKWIITQLEINKAPASY